MKLTKTLLIALTVFASCLTLSSCKNTQVSGSVSYGYGYGMGGGYPMYYGSGYPRSSAMIVVRPSRHRRY